MYGTNLTRPYLPSHPTPSPTPSSPSFPGLPVPFEASRRGQNTCSNIPSLFLSKVCAVIAPRGLVTLIFTLSTSSLASESADTLLSPALLSPALSSPALSSPSLSSSDAPKNPISSAHRTAPFVPDANRQLYRVPVARCCMYHQKDVTEKNHQVSTMGQVYSNARITRV